jgi:hypothetical protein
MKKPSPRQLTWLPQLAIREHCLWCCENREQEVAMCSSQRCPLHPYRSGDPFGRATDYYTVIRRKCLDCVTGSRSEVLNCLSVACPLWCFRMGKYGCAGSKPAGLHGMHPPHREEGRPATSRE